MKTQPSLAQVEELAAIGSYTIVPVSAQILSDFITPVEAVRILKNVSRHCYLLESAQANEQWGATVSWDMIRCAALALPMVRFLIRFTPSR